MDKEKKKKKKISHTKTIKNLRTRYACLDENYWTLWNSKQKLVNYIAEIQKVFPTKYFKITFKIQANNRMIGTYTEIKKNFSLDLAIDDLKKNKTYPDTFELVDLQILG